VSQERKQKEGDGGDRIDRRERVDERHVLRVRAGHGANCSSIGSVIDTLFATATVGAAVFAAVVAALEKEDVRVVGPAARTASAPAAERRDREPQEGR
jgi:hypothetical protein